MKLRSARAGDAVARVARASLDESYGEVLDDDTIDRMVDEWYAAEQVERALQDPSSAFVVADEDDRVFGFAQGSVFDEDPVVGEIHWIHVLPEARDRGIGVRLLGSLQEELAEHGASVVRGLSLEDNDEGAAFFEEHGFERVSSREVTIAGEDRTERVYEKRIGDGEDAVVERYEGPDGEELFVDFAAGERGTEAPWYPAYYDRSLDETYGWFCSNCESLETTMDTAGRIACSRCENTRAATRWDGSYL